MKWKKLALTLYMRMYGRRCVICSKIVEEKDAHIEALKCRSMYQISGKDVDYCLMHEACRTQEKL